MNKIGHAISEIHRMSEIAARDQWVNKIHPLVKLCLTILYIGVVVSFGKYDIIGLFAMAVYPFVVMNLAELSFKECLWRLRVVLPIVCVVGIANPFFDKTLVDLGGVVIRAGILSFIALMMKGIFAVLASYLLIATTTIEEICYALRLIHVPTILVTQILLTYRYITVLLSEVSRITQAYSLRAPGQKGVHFKAWGSLTGQLLLRSIDLAENLYDSMTLRGYSGEFRYIGASSPLRRTDLVYLIVWIAIFGLFRSMPVILVIGNFVGGIFA